MFKCLTLFLWLSSLYKYSKRNLNYKINLTFFAYLHKKNFLITETPKQQPQHHKDMPKVLHEITELEKASLLLRHYNNEKSYKNAFLLSHPKRKALDPGLDSAVSRWRNKDGIQLFTTEIEQRDKTKVKAELLNLQRRKENQTQRDQDQDGNGNGEKKRETLSEDWHNFTDLSEFLSFCEMQANLLTDEKDRKDYLKMIADLMRYKDQDKGNNDLQRFYTPLQCLSCPLYNENK